MKTNIKIFQKHIILILFLWANISAFLQKVQTGIYEIIYDVDTAFVHQNIKKLVPENNQKDITLITNTISQIL